MWGAWRRRAEQPVPEERPADDRPIPPISYADLPLIPIHGDPAPPDSPDDWLLPFPDRNRADTVPDDQPPAPAPAAPAEPMPFFAFDDTGAPGTAAWRSAGWWLRAEAKTARRAIAAAA